MHARRTKFGHVVRVYSRLSAYCITADRCFVNAAIAKARIMHYVVVADRCDVGGGETVLAQATRADIAADLMAQTPNPRLCIV